MKYSVNTSGLQLRLCLSVTVAFLGLSLVLLGTLRPFTASSLALTSSGSALLTLGLASAVFHVWRLRIESPHVEMDDGHNLVDNALDLEPSEPTSQSNNSR